MIKFGTGGWRAIIADEFTKENIRLLMAGLCRLMEKEGLAGAEICVGYDRRFLSKESAHWAAEVLAGCGKLVEPGRPEVVAQALSELFADPAGARVMGERARARCLEKFGAESSRQALLALLDELK